MKTKQFTYCLTFNGRDTGHRFYNQSEARKKAKELSNHETLIFVPKKL